MNKTFYVFGLLSLFTLGAGCANASDTAAIESSNLTVAQAEEPTESGVEEATDGAIEFTVNAANFSFAPNMMTVTKGSTVRIVFQNLEGFHDFRIDELDVATRKLQAKESDTIEFVADQVGSFEYYCSIGSHRSMGMWGTLVVKE